MYFWFLLVFISTIFFTSSGIMAQEKAKADSEVSFPGEVSGWKWDGKENHYNRKTIFDYINGAGELYIAYNFNGSRCGGTKKPTILQSSPRSMTWELPKMPSGSFLSRDRTRKRESGRDPSLGRAASILEREIFCKRLRRRQGKEAETATLDLGKVIANSIKSTGPVPKLLSVLPNGKAGLLEKSARYLRSHILLNQRFFIANQNILNLNPKRKRSSASICRASTKSTCSSFGTPKKPKRAQPCRNSRMPICRKSGLKRDPDRR